MTAVEALLLGIIQGLTEFFPVSSSGHLKLAESLFGYEQLDQYILFDLACHLGTLGSIFFVFGAEIFRNRQRFKQLAVACLPLFPLLLIMKPIKELYAKPEFLGYFFICTALLLWVGSRFQLSNRRSPWRDALVIGGFQALAILPGISRSGSTISGARLLGWTPDEAFTFSFLLAIPTILGGTAIEATKAMHLTELALPFSHYFIGFAASALVGTASLLTLKSLVRKHSFLYFSWYCLLIGILTLYLFHGQTT